MSAKEADVKELQKAYMEMQAIDQQMKQATQQVQQLEQQIAEIHTIAQSVAELGDVKEGTELFVPIANGIFAKASVGKTQELLVNVGTGVVVPTPIEGVRALLEQQAVRVGAAKDDIVRQMEELSKHAKKVEATLRKLIA